MSQGNFKNSANILKATVSPAALKHDAHFEMVETGSEEYKLCLVVLQKHFSKNGPAIIREAFEKLDPDMAFIDSIHAPEGQVALEIGKSKEIPVIDFSAPPFSSVMMQKVVLTPRNFLKLVFGQLLTDSQYNVLEIMRRKAAALNLNLSVVHALVAQFNVELLSNRELFLAENMETSSRFIRAFVDLNWHRIRAIQPKGMVLGVVLDPYQRTFLPDFKPALTYSEQELKHIDREIEFYNKRLENQDIAKLPSKEESILFLHGILDEFDAEKVKSELISVEDAEPALTQLLNDCEGLMKEGSYLMAARRARVLVELGVQSPDDLLKPCLKAVYQQFTASGDLPFASLMAEIMREFEIGGAQQLIDHCSHEYWDILNKLRGGLAANAAIPVQNAPKNTNEGVKENLPTGYT